MPDLHVFLQGLKKFADDEKVLDDLMAAKMENKKRLASYIKQQLNIDIDTSTLFDVQVRFGSSAQTLPACL
jgi:starch phosphorylase